MKFINILSLLFCVSFTQLFAANKAEDLYGWWVLDGDYIKTMMEEMRKNGNDKDKQFLKFFAPMIEKMLDTMTLVFTKNEIITYKESKERKLPYELVGIEGNTFKVKAKGQIKEFVIENGRLYSKTMMQGPRLFMKKLSATEINTRKKMFQEAVLAHEKRKTEKRKLIEKGSPRDVSNKNIRLLIQGITIQTNLDVRNRYRKEWIKPGGLQTVSSDDKADLLWGGEEVKVTNSGNVFQIFKELKGKHPYGGYYIFNGIEKEGRGKKKGENVSRIVMEIYDWEKGDGQVAIGFGDARVKIFPAPNRKLSKEDIVKILSVKGDKSLFGDGK